MELAAKERKALLTAPHQVFTRTEDLVRKVADAIQALQSTEPMGSAEAMATTMVSAAVSAKAAAMANTEPMESAGLSANALKAVNAGPTVHVHKTASTKCAEHVLRAAGHRTDAEQATKWAASLLPRNLTSLKHLKKAFHA